MSLLIHKAHIENLRGYQRASLGLARSATILVGQNNSGKTSILRIINWLINHAPDSLLDGTDLPTSDDIQFLIPARSTPHRARRLTLEIEVSDGRSYSKYKCKNGIAQLRFNIRQTPHWNIYLAIGDPVRGEKAESQPLAIELLQLLRKEHVFLYIPSFRDGHSPRFKTTLHDAFRSKISERALHSSPTGAPSEYRKIKKALDQVRDVAEDLANPLWNDMRKHLPPGLAKKARISLDSTPEDLVDWLTKHLNLIISTGLHDEEMVHVTDLGSGLQSLLDLAVHCSIKVSGVTEIIFVIEEPESFLHPSAQRTLARSLLSNPNSNKTIITTHSPIIVEEANYSDIVICSDQRFYEPSIVDGQEREEINAALLNGYGAEMVFAKSVLLVEGEGDRLLFERLRRRLTSFDNTGRTDELFVVPVGGNNRFAPWIRLLESYAQRGDRPIKWFIAADGDASAQVRQAFSNVGLTIPSLVNQSIGAVGAAQSTTLDAWVKAIIALNRATRSGSINFALLPVDLEHAALSNAGQKTLTAIAQKIECADSSMDGLLRFLGSKATSSTNGVKQPWMRGAIANIIPWRELNSEVRAIVSRWLEGVMPRSSARTLLQKADFPD